MNPLVLAKNVLREAREITVDEAAEMLLANVPAGFWEDGKVRLWCATQMVRPALRSLGHRSIRQSSVSEPGKIERSYIKRDLWGQAEYQDAINQLTEGAREDCGMAGILFKEGTERGYQLTLQGIDI